MSQTGDEMRCDVIFQNLNMYIWSHKLFSNLNFYKTFTTDDVNDVYLNVEVVSSKATP